MAYRVPELPELEESAPPQPEPVHIHFDNPFSSAFWAGLGFFTAALLIGLVAYIIVMSIIYAHGGQGYHL